ncbi:anti-sigma factor [Larsenimonas salina]|uniref:anti-sigma factor n=1 Tax=Larsenimonas salina TaxID=1295565 RepID=UPI0020733234|nr:anti-sigma factor [Larsenimonas salina]
MTENDTLNMLAAEYVLGTLDADDRADIARRRLQEPDLDALILAWEARLAPLSEEALPVSPRPELRTGIEQRIDALEAEAARQQTEHSPIHCSTQPRQPELHPPPDSQIEALRRRLARWQWSTGLACAAALVLAVILASPLGNAPSDPSFVAVFQKDDRQPAFMLSVDLSNRQLHVRPVSAEPVAGKSYQLWIKDDALGPTPRSLGVLNDDLSLDTRTMSEYDPALLKRATFGISIEPSGGSPTGQPTGPAIHGVLYPTGQPEGQHL